MPTESTQWRKFLQPVVTGLVALMAAGVGYLQYLQRADGEKRDSRIAVLEQIPVSWGGLLGVAANETI